jgi:hypothetical protein
LKTFWPEPRVKTKSWRSVPSTTAPESSLAVVDGGDVAAGRLVSVRAVGDDGVALARASSSSFMSSSPMETFGSSILKPSTEPSFTSGKTS